MFLRAFFGSRSMAVVESKELEVWNVCLLDVLRCSTRFISLGHSSALLL